MTPVHVRFWRLVNSGTASPGPCWPWEGRQNGYGYGMFDYTAKPKHSAMAHRVAWELERGPIPEGLTLDHLCLNKICVNPSHLEPVTLRENILRSPAVRAKMARTHCPVGHPYSGANLRIRFRNGTPTRACRACGSRAKRRAAVEALAVTEAVA